MTPVDQRAVFTAVVYMLTSGCAWRMLPPSFGVSVPTAHRRFAVWTQAGVWRRLHRAGIPLAVAISGVNVHDSRSELW
nr:transposase [Nocardia alni]